MAAVGAGGVRLARAPFAEREDRARSAADQWALAALGQLRRWLLPPAALEVRRCRVAQAAQQAGLAALDDAALVARLRAAAPPAWRSRRGAALRQALVLAGECARRVLGITPHPEQLAGAATLLRGRLAEMQTGEGKTLTAGLAALVAGAAGVPVHVVTVNDYLAARDAAHLGPLFALAGLRTGAITHEVQPAARGPVYACDITYCTGKELVFDYLRDRVATGGRASAAQLGARGLFAAGARPTVLRGLHFAIVDEADSILIDEARTPLILAEQAGDIAHAAAHGQAVALARSLAEGTDFVVEPAWRALRLTPAGRDRVLQASAGWGAPWGVPQAREHLMLQALRALHLYQRDQHYLIDAEGKVQIIDEFTGRVLPGRTWEQGLHQMIETKEGLALSKDTRTLARITYQRFFVRYLRLAGMTGTAAERARELTAVYQLDTVVLPTHRRPARRLAPARLCADEAGKWAAVADTVATLQRRGQPVLVGTRSVDASERLSAVLAARGLAHAVLNARQDAAEAVIVAAAGAPGAVTVATNMAGRGTDIPLAPGVAAVGGLAVVLTEFHESARIDRQLIGRCARQGDPGLGLAIVALDDELFHRHGGAELGLLRRLLAAHPRAAAAWLPLCRALAQRRAERKNARTRRDTLRQDRQFDKLMAFSGDPV